MTGLSDIPQAPQRYILNADHQPVPCDDKDAWQAFMQKGKNIVVSCDLIGETTILTVFLGLNHGTVEQPKFFQCTVNHPTKEINPPVYLVTWDEAGRKHKGMIKCVEVLARYHADWEAGIDRSFKAVNTVVSQEEGKIFFYLASDDEAIRVLPSESEYWHREGHILVFTASTL